MSLFYTFSLLIYYLGILFYSLFNEKAKKWIIGRKNQNYPNLNGKKVVWFHCASLGEFDQGVPLMNKIKANDDVFLLLTFFSPSGMEHYKKRNVNIDYACYIPLDTKANARKFINYFNPKEAYFIKYEFWRNHIIEAKRKGTKIYSVSSIFRENQWYFSKIISFFKQILFHFDYFFVQDQKSLELLKNVGITNVIQVGDIRFDRVIEHKNNVQHDEIIEKFTQNKLTWIVGSSWKIDIVFLNSAISNFEGKIIIAPHNIDNKHIEEIYTLFSNQTVRYTDTKIDFTKKILLLDCIGKLANAYSYGDFAYVGGGFTGKLHNILEPAVFGLPVILGPKHNRFPEAKQFIKEGIAFSVSKTDELDKAIHHILENSANLSLKTQEFIEKNKGVVDKIIEKLTTQN